MGVSYFNTLKKTSSFRGRASRSEYWNFMLVNMVVLALAMLFEHLTKFQFDLCIIGPISTLLLFIFFIPTIAVTVRRLHDVGKGGYWIFLFLLPIIGQIWFLLLLVRKGVRESNYFGMNPRREIMVNRRYY